MINNNHYFDPAEMARNAITSLLSYLTLSDGFWISEGSNPGFGPLEGSNTGIWTPQILDPGPWIWTHLGPPRGPLFGPIWDPGPDPWFQHLTLSGGPSDRPHLGPSKWPRLDPPRGLKWVKSRDLDPSESGFGQIWGLPFWEKPWNTLS